MKTYISPIAKVFSIETETLIAQSEADVDNEKQDNVMGGSNRRRIIWDDEF